MTRLVAGVTTAVVLAVVGAVLLAVALMMMVMTGTAPSAAASVTSCLINGTNGSVTALDADQQRNARLIIAVGKAEHVPPRGWAIAIAAALQESGLRNLPYGDRDSLGLMQQRPSAGWGTAGQVTDPGYAIRAFYGGPTSPAGNTGLLDVTGWQHMPVWQAAQSVQHSAYPFAYAAHETLAWTLVRRLAHITTGCDQLASGPWTLPVHAAYTLTSGFGPRVSPTTGAADFHTGQDFAAPVGTPALAVSSGTVVFVGWDGGYGNLVRVRHADGVESWYGHLSATAVTVGQRVRPGQEIGRVGTTGNSTGPHLHLEIRVNGRPTDPMVWLRRKGLDP